jgi:PAS domain S-box-containing protein
MAPEDLGFGALFWHLREAVIVADLATQQVALWNPAAAALFGYEAEEAVGLSLDALLPEFLRLRLHETLAQFGAVPQDALHTSQEVPLLHRSGALLDVEVTLYLIEGSVAPGRHLVALLRDLQTTRRDLQLAGVLLAARTAEHEVNNELARVVGFCELLLHRTELAPEHRRWAEEALDGARQAAIKIQRLGHVSQVVEKHFGPTRDPDFTTIDLERSIRPSEILRQTRPG